MLSPKYLKILYFFIAPILSCLILFFYFQINPFTDLRKYYFQGDGMFVFFWIKNIAIEKSFYCSKHLAFPVLDTNCFRDFVLDHNYLQVMIYHIIAFFTKNFILIQVIYNCLTHIFIALITNLVLLKFKISKFLSAVISTFFSVALAKMFFAHNFTVGFYFSLPLIFLIIYWFYEKKIDFVKLSSQKKLFLSPNKYCFLTLIFGFLSIISSAYYAYMFLVILGFGLIMICLRGGKIKLEILNISLIFIIFILFAFFICFENFVFNFKYGYNDVVSRTYKAVWVFEMTFANLILPVENHYLELMRNIAKIYKNNSIIYEGEGFNCQIGILNFTGYCLLLLLQMKIILAKNLDNDKKYFQFFGAKFTPNRLDLLKFLSIIALLTFLYFSSGGFYRITHFFYSQFRAVCRFNIIFTLLGLIFWGIYFDQLIEQQKHKKKQLISKILVTIIFVIGYLDAVGKPDLLSKNFASNQKLFENDKKFVEEIENYLPKASKIFVYPVFGFPEAMGNDYRSVSGYLHSKDLIFSYPMPKNRKSHLWQSEVAKLEFDEFVRAIKNAGFNGVWLEKYSYNNQNQEINIMEENLKKLAKK